MTESEFAELAGKTLQQIETALENSDAELDWELAGDGILTIEFEDGSQIVINKHSGVQEIWVAAKSGGFHYRWQDGQWLNTREGSELLADLSRVCSQQACTPVSIG